MLLLLPYLIPGAVLSVITSLGAGYESWLLVLMLIVWLLAYSVGLLVLYLLAVAVISLFVDMEKPQKTVERFYFSTLKYALGLLCVFSRVRIHLSGEDKLPVGAFLLVANHRSNFDPLVTLWALRGRDLAFISKPENLRIPVVGKYMHKCCFMAIDRDNDRAALRTILDAAALLREGQVSVAIYPEGTRNHGEGLLPFRNGAFRIAQRAKAPIVVMTTENVEKIGKNAPFRHTDVYITIREVISAEEAASLRTGELGEKIRRCMLCESD